MHYTCAVNGYTATKNYVNPSDYLKTEKKSLEIQNITINIKSKFLVNSLMVNAYKFILYAL